ncbi:MAG: DJ-1/PfpI family protein [Oscillospiraceae bacterium]|nr:DJ-1/PfpI family protein [Oscillospiraceae bacterium]MBO4915865.1 DJ-1/PfpI family protein [Oscillospiraceae bacterium]
MLFAEGFEEVEALTVVDLLRRAEIGCDMVSLAGTDTVTGSHGISVGVQCALDKAQLDDYDAIILPGGMPGTKNLASDSRVIGALSRFCAAGKLTAAICAAPTVLAAAGVLEGRRAVCYPGMEGQLTGRTGGDGPVEVDGTVITSRGVGTAIPFALAIVEYFSGADKARELARAIVYR